MAGGPPATRYAIRAYREADREQVCRFRCARIAWERDAEKVIRRAPTVLDDPNEDPIEIAVAVERERVLGVIVYGPENQIAVTVWAIGVMRPYQKQGIGTKLKIAALADVAYRDEWPDKVQSVVHKQNFAMRRVNDKLRVRVEIDPQDPRYLLTAIVPAKRR